jgi:hypothetical protein
MLVVMTRSSFSEPPFLSATLRRPESSRGVRSKAWGLLDKPGRHTHTFSAFRVNRSRTLPELA